MQHAPMKNVAAAQAARRSIYASATMVLLHSASQLDRMATVKQTDA